MVGLVLHHSNQVLLVLTYLLRIGARQLSLVESSCVGRCWEPLNLVVLSLGEWIGRDLLELWDSLLTTNLELPLIGWWLCLIHITRWHVGVLGLQRGHLVSFTQRGGKVLIHALRNRHKRFISISVSDSDMPSLQSRRMIILNYSGVFSNLREAASRAERLWAQVAKIVHVCLSLNEQFATSLSYRWNCFWHLSQKGFWWFLLDWNDLCFDLLFALWLLWRNFNLNIYDLLLSTLCRLEIFNLFHILLISNIEVKH